MSPEDGGGCPERRCEKVPPVNWVGIRNFLIIAALAGVALVWEKGFGSITASANQIITVIFVAAMIAFAYNYFRQNKLAWLVMKKWMQAVIIVCGLGIAFLIIAGFELLSDRLSPLGVLALIIALALVIVWVLRESRKFRI
jgi:cbb3-type cytochrome oxidase subunit 3